jgi:hypothetical protein
VYVTKQKKKKRVGFTLEISLLLIGESLLRILHSSAVVVALMRLFF